MVFCSNCGEKQGDSANFCSKCGTQLSKNSSPVVTKSSSPVVTKSSSFSPKPAKTWGSPSTSSVKTKGYATTVQTHSGSGGNYSTGGSVKSVVSGKASTSNQSTFNEVGSSGSGAVKCGLAKTTYEKQPSWAFAEQHKNNSGQYKHGQFRHLNQ